MASGSSSRSKSCLTPVKRPRVEFLDEDRVYRFKVLLPNGTSVVLELHEPRNEMPLQDFIHHLKHQYFTTVKSYHQKRKILWRSADIYVQDAFGNNLNKNIPFRGFEPCKLHYLTLHDGAEDTADTFENMWDLTPDTEMLMELPEEYTFETALADLIDNSLQAIWSNGPNERRLVCVTVDPNGISVFDSGPGMDSSDKNSIVKWGKMGSSLHRSARGQGIGGHPPYLTPFFGMFGYGGAIASMHLGRRALVSSKTKESKKVYTLHLEREALLNSSGEKTWKTDGGLRDPLKEEFDLSPHGSFTKVEIFEPKVKSLDTYQLKCRLKDIYFPYIQCDEMLATRTTTMPVEFQVDDEDLAEIEGGEVAITNLLSCNGPEFVIQLHLSTSPEATTFRSPGSRASKDANARMKFVYFPIVEGKECIDKILDRLKEEQCGPTETFDSFSRVSIRRLGRLLPDARWGRLPFMEPRSRKGDRAQLLKRCCLRVKCFIETDAGFNPTPYKTDLAHHHPYTIALKNFGSKPVGKESAVMLEMHSGAKPLGLSQLEKEYEDWILKMHDRYDEEVVGGEDQPVLVVNPQNKKGLGISSEVVRVHKVIRRKGATWKFGQHIKILKGAAGCHKNNLYATLEYILLEGFQGDVGGEARLICRPLDVPVQNGCLLQINSSNASLDIRSSLSFPISVIDVGKCKIMEPSEWTQQLEKLQQKSPATIDVLAAQECQELELDGALPTDRTVYAGIVTPRKVIAVIRPAIFSSSSFNKLDKKYIIKDDDIEMSMEVTHLSGDNGQQEKQHVFGERTKPSLHKGVQGLYIFSLGSKKVDLFHCAGIYTFTFTANCKDASRKQCEKTVTVVPSIRVGRWGLLTNQRSSSYHVRVGEYVSRLSIACFDVYNNRMPFVSTPDVLVKVNPKGCVCVHTDRMNVYLSSDKMKLEISDIWLESRHLDGIRPSYDTTLEICSKDGLFYVHVSCLVTPGHLHHVRTLSMASERCVCPGDLIEELILEMFDNYGNHVQKGLEVSVNLDGFHFQDHNGSKRKVDENGCINLSGILKVVAGYGEIVSLSVNHGEEYFRKEFQVEKRMLKIVSPVPDCFASGSRFENIIFEIVNSEGAVDETVDDKMKFGECHTLRITSESPGIDDRFQYSFRRGRCIVPCIPIPKKEGVFSFVAAYSKHPDLFMNVKVHVVEMLSQTDPGDWMPSERDDGEMFLLEDVNVPEHIKHLVESVENNESEMELHKIGIQVGEHEKKLSTLRERKKVLKQRICNLQERVEPQSLSLLDYFMSGKEVILKRIEEKTDSAAAIFCEMLKTMKSEGLQNCDIIGPVALLGTVRNNNLSRMLARYLGEDYMLALVCKSSATARFFEKYDEHGKEDKRHALHAFATELRKSTGRVIVICLEEISSFEGRIEGHNPQKKLALMDPLLPTGKIPPGFLGYAVNMINLDTDHLGTRTAKGHGLRETLFYFLFGELQVYETRQYMKQALSYIRHGAVSLDGGIMKGNGILSLGYWETKVCFPVASSEVQGLSTDTVSVLAQIVDKKLELESTHEEIDKESMAHSKTLQKFQKRKDRCIKFFDDSEPILTSHLDNRQFKEPKLESPSE